MKVLHINAGAEEGGGKTHILSLLSECPKKQVVLAVFEEGLISHEARKLGIEVHTFPQKSRYDLSILSSLARFINKEGFDIIHTHGPRANFYASLIKKRINAKWATTIHSNPTLDFMKRGLKGWIFTKVNLWTFSKVDFFFAISEPFKENLMNLGIKEESIGVIYNGINYDLEIASPLNREKELNVKDTDFVLTHVARLDPVKGHEILFQAVKDVRYDNVKVLLVGDGLLANELKESVKSLNLEEKVIFLGFRNDVARVISSSNLSILTSHSESLPIVLLESANQHITCITTNVGGVEKLIPNCEYGWVVPPGDSKAVSKAIEEAYERWNSGKLSDMGDKLYEKAVKDFSLKRLYEDTWKYYEKMVK